MPVRQPILSVATFNGTNVSEFDSDALIGAFNNCREIRNAGSYQGHVAYTLSRHSSAGGLIGRGAKTAASSNAPLIPRCWHFRFRRKIGASSTYISVSGALAAKLQFRFRRISVFGALLAKFHLHIRRICFQNANGGV